VNLDEVRERARAAGLGDIADAFSAMAAPGLLLDAVAADGPAVARIGGLPRLPAGMEWPMSRWTTVETLPLAYIAEVDLAALDPSIWPGPTTGKLVFFSDIDVDALFVDSGGAALVVHVPADAACAPVAMPAELDEELRYRALSVGARPVTTLPSGESEPELLELGFTWSDRARHDAYQRMRADLMGLDAHWGPQHQLLGWPQSSGDGLSNGWPQLHREAVESGLSSDDPAPEHWRLLLQISSDYDRTGMEFGDGGHLFFAIPHDDLARGRFDRVQAITDSA
jgi:hypothetical protein